MDRRERLTEIFADTEQFIKESPMLKQAAEKSCKFTKLYDDPGIFDPIETADQKPCEITVANSRTFEAAMRRSKEFSDKKIAVLNFASATCTGGGVKTGASAQEECLCRCSTLYPTLTQDWLWQKYYKKNRDMKNNLHTDACIYSPDIIICKSDTDFPERLKADDWCTVDVISCAAPNLRREPTNQYNPETGKRVKIAPEKLYDLHLKRAKAILNTAVVNDVDILITGAFGCGAFANDPHTVAEAWKEAVHDCRNVFSAIEFAIYCRPFEEENLKIFERIIRGSYGKNK